MRKILLTGGGTAGHVMPNLALLPDLQKHFDEIHYIGSFKGIEKELISKEKNIEYHPITTVKLVRSLTLKNLAIPLKLLKGIKESKKLLKEIKPDVVFSKGGFVAVPVTIAAKSLNIPIVAHESDLTLGLANKIVLKKCNVMCCSFEKTVDYCKGKGKFTGSAIRESLFNGSRQQGLQECVFQNTNNFSTILVIGGSSGAKKINDVVFGSVSELCKKHLVVHIVGKNNINPSIKHPNYKQIEFTNKIENLFALADVVVTRAGSNAIMEFLSLCKPMLLIPLPKDQSRGDQLLNAEEFKNKNYANVLLQENLSKSTLIEQIEILEKNKNKYIQNMKANPCHNGKNKILQEILNCI